MIEYAPGLSEEMRLEYAEQEAKLARAEFLAQKAIRSFESLDQKSEHYGMKYGEVLQDAACAYRLAYESISLGQKAQTVLHSIEMFCQKNLWNLKKGEVVLPGLKTVRVVIDSEQRDFERDFEP